MNNPLNHLDFTSILSYGAVSLPGSYSHTQQHENLMEFLVSPRNSSIATTNTTTDKKHTYFN